MANNGERAEAIGNRVSDFRTKTLGLTQDKFIDEFERVTGEHISRSALSLIEGGKQEPNLDTLIALANFMRMDVAELVDIELKKIIVVDTNILLKCPLMAKNLSGICDRVVIPQVVIDELNYRKDHGNEQQKRLASLCMSNLIEQKSDDYTIDKCPDEGSNNDDRIFALAVELAKSSSSNTVYIFTNDKYFSLKDVGKCHNIKVIGSREFDTIFRQETFYNLALSQKFFVAVHKGDMVSAKNLANKNIDVNYVDSRSGFTPLIEAIRSKNHDMVDFLLSLPQIDINAVDDFKHKLPAISHAIQMNQKSFVEQLICNGANVNEPSQSNKNAYNTPLMIASWEGKLELVKLLVENGACINQQDKGNGFTALIKAVYRNHPDVVEYLVSKNADKTICAYNRQTALDIAYEKNAGNRYMDIIHILQG